MGNCLATDDNAKQNASVNRDIKKAKQTMDREIKVLLLGAGESGKSTIFKQMKIIHQSGFSKEECLLFREVVQGNVLKAMKALVAASLNLSIPIESPENRERAQYINGLDNEVLLHVGKVWNLELADNIQALWKDAGIQKTFDRRSEYQLDDSAPYYFSELDRIKHADYIPTEADVLRSRVKTTGIVEAEFKLNSQVVKMIDVGGQRNERKKWIHCFEGVTAIIFVSSLAEYDQKCYEDDSTNRMQESLLLFEEICNSKFFMNTSVILFLNKTDLFETKIKNTDLTACPSFNDYDGGKDFHKATQYIMKKFQSLVRVKTGKMIYTHLTCATDTSVMRKVFDAIKDIILQKALVEQGII